MALAAAQQHTQCQAERSGTMRCTDQIPTNHGIQPKPRPEAVIPELTEGGRYLYVYIYIYMVFAVFVAPP